MAETGTAGTRTAQSGDGFSRSSPTVLSAPPKVGTGYSLDDGQPVFDLPPLVEPEDFAESAVPGGPIGENALALRPPVPAQRPARRRFLAPVAAAPRADRMPPPAIDPGSPASLRAGRLQPPRESPPPMAAVGPQAAPTLSAEATPSQWRWRLAAGAGIGIALALAMAGEIGVEHGPLRRVAALLGSHLARPRPASPAGPAPQTANRRAGFLAERAKAGDAAAQLALAVLYAKGDGVAQDYAQAAKWFYAAAEQGVARAQYDLGVLCERGRGVPLDYAQAAAWYRKAAEQNHPLAQYNLAVAYTKGQGVKRDLFAAAVWYHRAAGQGVVAAMVNLAILYERGDGVDASVVDAYAWYRAAARRGSRPAAQRADALLRAFTPSQQTRAEAKTAELAGKIHDALGERARLAETVPAAPGGPQPVLKSGIENDWNSAGNGGIGSENP